MSAVAPGERWHSLPGLGPPGAQPPVGPSNDRAERSGTQARSGRLRRRPRRRRCLLKGCERRFKPRRPQGRYCSAACVSAARAWSRWKARQAYRRGPRGRESRRRSHKTYRLRRAAREAAAAPPRGSLEGGGEAEEDPSRGSSLSVAGGVSCDRPGCYDLFWATARSPKQRFCKKSCRCAMERVWQRERRWRAGRGLGPRRARAWVPVH
jgi:hypothetical protein